MRPRSVKARPGTLMRPRAVKARPGGVNEDTHVNDTSRVNGTTRVNDTNQRTLLTVSRY